ncbi:unnamed protein product [Sphenostylis stenocarpa]|uniref:Uncharacterized protein n=1 Tax=Sphenostylis stenocarpa TaxID=92480 RepID=A0AA86VKI8_9FABA|nr:unnamed protein product [Sphenostylis stenocarpa]
MVTSRQRWSQAGESRAVHAMVGSSPVAINFGVTLVGTFVFGILSEEHPSFAKESSRGIEDKVPSLLSHSICKICIDMYNLLKNIASTFHPDNAKF